MSATIDLHGPYEYEPELYPTGTKYQPAPYTTLAIRAPGVTARLYLRTVADCDALIEAARHAIDLLLTAQAPSYPEQPPPDAGDSE